LFKAPSFLGYVFNIAKGVKLHLHRIHIRYEDDYFNHHRPFSMGILIEALDLNNKDTHWEFETPNGMKFKRQRNQNVNIEFNIVRFQIYLNSYSAMNVPTTLWESTLKEDMGIFSAIEAVEILDYMTMPFNPNTAVMMN